MNKIESNIPIGIVITLIIQTGALFLWGGTITEKVNSMEEGTTKHEIEDKEFQQSMERIGNRLTIIETLLRSHGTK